VSEYVGFGKLKIIERQRREEAERAREAESQTTEASGTQVARTQVPQVTALPEPSDPGSESAEVRQTQVRQTQVRQTPVPKTQVTEAQIRGAAGRYLQLDHSVVDDFLPRLQPYEQLVYLRLFRLTVGFGRKTCVVSHAKLAEKTRLSLSTIKRTCGQLEANGYVRSRPVLGGSHVDRGCEFELLEPTWLFETQVSGTQVRGTRPSGTQVRGTQVPQSDMKDRKESHETAPTAIAVANVFEIRTIAARLFEAHRGESGFDHNRLRQLVRDALIGQGRIPEGEAIEDAIRGMAV
jgi:hypothetical protein